MHCAAEEHKQYSVYDSEDHKTTKILDLDACVSNNNYQIKRRMKDVKVEESNGPVSTELSTIRSNSNICIPPRKLQNRNALSPSSCMIQEAEQRSTLSICTNEQPAAHVQLNALKNSTISSPRVACLDEGLTAAAQTPHSTACRSTLTLGKGMFFTFRKQ